MNPVEFFIKEAGEFLSSIAAQGIQSVDPEIIYKWFAEFTEKSMGNDNANMIQNATALKLIVTGIKLGERNNDDESFKQLMSELNASIDKYIAAINPEIVNN